MNGPEQTLVSISGQLNARFADKICDRLTGLADIGPIAALFCSDGGETQAGIRLYEFFARFRGDLTIYISSAMSAGAIAVLGAPKKKIVPYGAVMLHAVLAKIGPLARIEDLRAAMAISTVQNDQLKSLISQHLPGITKGEWAKYEAGYWAPSFERMIEFGMFRGPEDRCKFPEGQCANIFPDICGAS